MNLIFGTYNLNHLNYLQTIFFLLIYVHKLILHFCVDLVEHCVILFLHSKLPQVEQHKVFMPVAHGKRKVR